MYIQCSDPSRSGGIYNLMKIEASPAILKKMREKHGIDIEEVLECFSNIEHGFIEDTREGNVTNPPTYSFIAETDHGKEIFVCFMQARDRVIHLKTAFRPDVKRKEFYLKNTRKK